MISFRQVAQIERSMIISLLAIMVLGVYNLESASRPTGVPLHLMHTVYLTIGIVVALLISSVHYRNLEALAYPIFFTILGLLVCTALFGKVVNGSRRWLPLGVVNLQTSDLAKIGIIVIVAHTFHSEKWDVGLTLREIFRPMNLSRPAAILLAVMTLLFLGESLRPAGIERWSTRGRFRPALKLKSKVETAVLGRGSPAAQGIYPVQVSFSGVEDKHAEVKRDDYGRWIIEDLGTEAGTFVNGERLEGPRLLNNNDIIQLGTNDRARLRFRFWLQSVRGYFPLVLLLGLVWFALAYMIQRQRGPMIFRDWVAPIDVVLAPCLLILTQPDLGTTLVILLIAFSMILYVGLRSSALFTLIGSGLGFAWIAWGYILKDYQKQRVMNFIYPEADLAGAGYHQHQSLIAVGSGGIFGKGHAQGTQTHLSFLPEQQTDFIFSVWGEEAGFLGSITLVILFTILIISGLRTAQRARDRFGALLVVGVTSMLFWHAIINMLMVLRFAPVVGVPLPFWSNGGSFVLTSMIGIGLVLSVDSRRTLFSNQSRSSLS